MRTNTKKQFQNLQKLFRRLHIPVLVQRVQAFGRLPFARGFSAGLGVVVVLAVGFSLFAFPQSASSSLINQDFGGTLGLGTTSLLETVIRVVQWFLGFLALVAVIIIMYGGFLWMTAAGNEDRIARAKKTIIRAAIGLVIILLSWAIVIFVVRFVTNSTSGNLPSHCYNGILDGDETGTDCGGSCNACMGPPVGDSGFVITGFQTSNGSGDPRNDVHLCSKVKSQYNRTVDQNTVTAAVTAGTIKVVQNPGASEVDVAGTWATSSKSVTFDPTDLLAQTTPFEVRIPKTLRSLGLPSLQLLGCSALGVPGCDGSGDPVTWGFTTGVDADSVRPSVTSTYPTFTAPDRNVSMLPVIEVNFSEPIDDTTIVDSAGPYPDATKFWLQELDGPGGSVVGPYTADYAADFAIETTNDGFRVQLNAAKPLKAFTWYRIRVQGVEDLCSNTMQGNGVDASAPNAMIWEFQTNDRAPGIASIYPEGTNQCPDTQLITTFNTTMFYNRVTMVVDGPGNNPHIVGTIDVEQGINTSVGGTFQVNDTGSPVDNNYRVYELVPSVPLPLNTDFTVTVTTDMVINGDGDTLERTWNFSTSDSETCACKPYITSMDPEQGLNGQCMTISGACFTGTTAHPAAPSQLVFQLAGNDYPATIGGFTGNQITTTVPNNGFNNGDLLTPQVTIDYADTAFGSSQTQNSAEKFLINGTGQATGPCLFSVSPTSGVRGQPNITLRGERFNSASATKQVVFEGGTNTVPVWSDTVAVTDVAATAIEKSCNQVFLRNSAGESNRVCFDVEPPGFRVTASSPPSCNDVCRNAFLGFQVTEDLAVATLSPTTATVYRCADSTCADADLVDLGLTPVYDSITRQVSFANPGLNQNAWYRIIVTGGPSGLRNTRGGELEGTNVTFGGDPAYHWKFKTRDNPNDCEIESVSLAPSTKTISTGDVQGYVAFPSASTQCGEALDPAGFSWNWATIDPAPNPPNETQLQSTSTCSDTGLPCTQAANCPTGKCVGMNLRSVLAIGPTAPASSTVAVSADTENSTAQLTITDCNTDAHCQNGCSYPGNGSVCNTTTKKCTPWIESIDGAPTSSGPKGSFVTVDGCYFGSSSGELTVGGSAAQTNVCSGGWTNSRIVASIPDVASGVPHIVRVRTSGGEVSNVNRTYTVTDLCPGGSPVPATGRPGICDLAPDTGRPGTGIRINGQSVGLTGLTRAVEFFSAAGTIQATDADLAPPGIWTNNVIDKIRVPAGAETGPVRVVVQGCPSNPLTFGISCGSSSDCGAGKCCQSGMCVDAALCSTASAGSLCQIPDNAATAGVNEQNPNCAAGPISAPAGYDCISDTGDRQSVAPPPPSAPNPAFGTDCRFCCVPGDVNAAGLTCIEDQGSCTTSNRGLYCGCDRQDQANGDAQCGGVLSCGSDTCCHPRPTVIEQTPTDGGTLACTNGYLGGKFSEAMQGSTINGTTIRLFEGIVQVPANVRRVGADGFSISPQSPLTPGVTYRVEVTGGSAGIQSAFGVTMSADVSWTFTVDAGANLCKIARVRVEMDSSTPSNLQERTDDLFTCEGNPTDTTAAFQAGGNFHCKGDQDTSSANGNQHYFGGVPVDAAGVMLDPAGFTWTFTESGPDIVTLSAANVDNDRFATNSATNGQESVTIVADGGSTLGRASSAARFRTFICKNPWPAGTTAEPFPFTDQNAPPHHTWTSGGPAYPGNFSFFYCRDRGDAGTADDLPAIRIGAGQPNVKNNTGALIFGNDLTKDELIKQFLFFTDEGVDDAESNAIGLRLMENYGYDGSKNHGLSIRDWYTRNAPAPQGSPSDILVDGYTALKDGRTTYVAGTNFQNRLPLGLGIYAKDLVHLVYLMSYAQNATPDTIEIFNRLVENWTFNTNVVGDTNGDGEVDKSQIQRDVRRIHDIETIETALITTKAETGAFPILQGGTYLNGQSTSKWPSWQETLGTLIGIDVPRDPANTLETCPAGYESDTCWREEDQRFVCPDNSHIYHYDVDPNGQGVRLYANLEDPLGQWATAADNSLFDCSSAGNSDCTCYNYQNDGSGNAFDRTPPTLDVEIDGNPPPFPPLTGTEVNSGATDPGSGVARVEFYIDGILQFTDVDGADGWKWDMDSRRYGDGAHDLIVVAFDSAGNRSTPFKNTIPSSSDGQYTITVGNGCPGCTPDVFIVTPLDGGTTGGLMQFKTISTDDGAVTNVDLKIEGGPVVETRTCSVSGTSVNCDWPGGGFDTTTVENGEYTLTAVATDNNGLFGRAEIRVKIDNSDTENPVVQITSPTSGAEVGGNASGQYTITVTSIATDNVGVTRVQYYVNGILLFTDTTGPYEFVWDTTKAPNGTATITAIAYDAVGRTGSHQVQVLVNNPNRPPGACAPTECASGDKAICPPDGCCAQNTCLSTTGQVCVNGQWRTACGDGTCQTNGCNEAFTCPQDCAGQPYCGNNVAEAAIGEICDDTNGTLPGGDLGGRSCNDLNADGVPDPGGFYCGTLGCTMAASDANRCKQLDTSGCISGSCGDGSIQCGEKCDGSTSTCTSPSFGTCTAAPTCQTCDCKYTLDCTACPGGTADHCTYCATVTGNCTGCSNGTECTTGGVPGTCQAGTCVATCTPGQQRCFNNTTQVCNASSAWVNEPLTSPDSKPGIPGDQFEGQCSGRTCYNNSDVTCGVVAGDAVCTIANGAPLTCGLTCSGFWAGVYCPRCGTAQTCNDGAQNCGETAVDTGGACGTLCGNGTIDGTEECDGSQFGGRTCVTEGFQGGNLTCSPTCTISTSSCTNQTCGNNVKEGSEACDGTDLGGKTCVTQGFQSGTLACNGTCTAFNLAACVCAPDQCRPGGNGACTNQSNATCGRNGTACVACGAGTTCTTATGTCDPIAACGNNTIEGSEVCDGTALNGQTCVTQGYAGGTLTCNASCTGYVTSSCSMQWCGNGIREGGEQCDGGDLNGNTCSTQGFASGSLGCTGICQFNTSSCLCAVGQCRSGGVCVDGTSQTQCGSQSGCNNCGNPAINVCNNGQCKPVCGPTECRNASGNCVPGNLSNQCGSGEEACTNCSPGTCSGGNCSLCGNGVIDVGEQCDSANLNGQTCTSQGYTGGTLACSPTCTFNTTSCTACTSDSQCAAQNKVCTAGKCVTCTNPSVDCNEPAQCYQSSGAVCNGTGTCNYLPAGAGTTCDTNANDCSTQTCNGSGTCNSANRPNGQICYSGSNAGACLTGNCQLANPMIIELTWNSAAGAPNDLDLFVFIEGQGVSYDGVVPLGSPVAGSRHFGDKVSGGSLVTETVVINSPVLSPIKYDIYVKNMSGGVWNTNPTVKLFDRNYTQILGTHVPDISCSTLPWWQIARVTFTASGSMTIWDGNRMMKDGGSDGITPSANVPTQFAMPYQAAVNYCCSSGIQCEAVNHGVGNACVGNKCVGWCGDNTCTFSAEDPTSCPSDCTMDWCDYSCQKTYGAAYEGGDFCTGPGNTCDGPGAGPNKSECVVNDGNNVCAGTSECCCNVTGADSC